MSTLTLDPEPQSLTRHELERAIEQVQRRRTRQRWFNYAKRLLVVGLVLMVPVLASVVAQHQAAPIAHLL